MIRLNVPFITLKNLLFDRYQQLQRRCLCNLILSERFSIVSTHVHLQTNRISTASTMSHYTMPPNSDPSLLTSNYDPAVKQLIKTLDLAKSSGVSNEIIEEMHKSLVLCQQRDQFAEHFTTKDSETCDLIRRETLSHNWRQVHDDKKSSGNLNPIMMSGHLEGQFLKSVLSGQKAKRVLDIGMFTGFSAVSIAEVLPSDGQVVTLDIEDYLKNFVENLIKESPHKGKIRIIIGNALDSMAKLKSNGETFDAIFMDAAKSEYQRYFELCLDEGLLNPGGTIIVDNAFLHGKSYLESNSPTAKFAEFLKKRTDIHTVLVPMRDGLYLVRRLQDVQGEV